MATKPKNIPDKMSTVIDKELKEPEPILLCKCLMDGESIEENALSPRKTQILSIVARTEDYLRVRKIPELIRFLVTKVIASGSSHPIAYLESLLNDCMLFRAGHGSAPVLYEDRHLQAVVKSFDPGNRGWLSSGQVRRAFTTLGLTLKDVLEDRIPCDVVLDLLRRTQEDELYKLLSAGTLVCGDNVPCPYDFRSTNSANTSK